MRDKSKNWFTLKIVISYLAMAVMAVVMGLAIYTEIKIYLSYESNGENDVKLLKTSSLLTHLYEAESLSKLAIQNKTKQNFTAYAQKIDSIFLEIDTLKQLTHSTHQKDLLDSVQLLLQQKIANSNELRNLKVRNDANKYIDNALKKINGMEASLGKITPEALAPNIEELPPKAQSVIREMADYLDQNVPRNRDNAPDYKKMDSILKVSKELLKEARLQESRTQRYVDMKVMKINQNDLELSHQLRQIIAALEQEVIVNTFNDNEKKQAAVKRTTRLAGLAALLGFFIAVIFTILIYRDFWRVQSYRQQLEREKKYSDSLLKSREQLISTVSHDLRTPLNTIAGYSELMENTSLNKKQYGYLNHVRSAAKYVDSLVNDLLDFSKLEAGKIKVEKIRFVLSELIRETAENLREINNKKENIELILNIDEDLDMPVLGDPFRIRQIITNLIGNAYKFTNEGFIQVSAHILGKNQEICTVQIEVLDSGIGIKKDKQRIIFKEFTQADDHTDKKYGGYGLGLTISKKLTKLLKGELSMKSEEGKGSTFMLTLPLELAKIPSNTYQSAGTTTKTLNILIIDDDTALLHLIKELCESLGIEALTYSNFSDLKPTDMLQYQVVLTDIQMPKVDGFGVLKLLQSREYVHYKAQPVIAMTGRRDLDLSVYTQAGFADILEKPFTKLQLLQKLQKVVPGHFYDKIPRKEAKMNGKPSKLFNLDLIVSFLGENEVAVSEVLNTFMRDSETNIAELNTAVANSDPKEISRVAHKMLPMFRQLKATKIIPDLETLEILASHELTRKDLNKIVRELEIHVAELNAALKIRLAKNPSYSG